MAKQAFASLRAAAVDGRTHNIFYRQVQLLKLHKALVRDTEAILNAIVSDSGNSRAEAQVEYLLAITELKNRYSELDPKKDLEDEYAISKGKDAANLRTGFGIVLVKAQTEHTLFFSVIAPLSGAIAAGNCVIVQIENSLRSLPTLLKSLLKETLDPDIFDIAQQPVSDSALLDECLQVVQGYDLEGVYAHNQLASNASAITAAVVDRTADPDKAAEDLVNARFAFKGRSPYAPDVVLVNEFIRKDFLQALVRQSISLGEGVTLENGALDKQKSRENGLKELIADLDRNGNARVLAQETSRAIVDIKQRSPQILKRKVKEPCLIVHGFKSLDDAIDLLNSIGKPLLAAYHWGGLGQCKYLSQFVSAQVSFANHVPAELLVGPTFPANHPIQSSTRYPTALFSKPTPAFVESSSKSVAVKNALVASSSSQKAAALQALRQEAMADLREEKRSIPSRAAFGFFEQAMVTNLSLVLVSTITVVGSGVYFLRGGRLGR